MTRSVRIAAHIYPQHGDYRDLRAAAVRAEEKGADIIYNWDHFFPLSGPPTVSTSNAGRCSLRGRR